jgi:hypothetical protein
MARMNWSKVGARNLMARRGVESIRGDMPFGLPQARRSFRPPPMTTAVRPITVELKCPCGHEGKARVKAGRKEYHFRCGQCGVSQTVAPATQGARRGNAS